MLTYGVIICSSLFVVAATLVVLSNIESIAFLGNRTINFMAVFLVFSIAFIAFRVYELLLISKRGDALTYKQGILVLLMFALLGVLAATIQREPGQTMYSQMLSRFGVGLVVVASCFLFTSFLMWLKERSIPKLDFPD